MPTALSLHIGLNLVDPGHYGGWAGPLSGCEADVETMSAICSAQGFTVSKLKTAQATRAAVTGSIQAAASALVAGDTFVVSYSGHGGQLPDLNGDETDGLDETWCLFDGELLDDELHELWGGFQRGVRVAVFSDSCHSGTVVRYAAKDDPAATAALVAAESGGVPRAMPIDVMRQTYELNRAMYDDLLARAAPGDPVCSLVLISGCQDNQLSYDGPFNGAFTGALNTTWARGAFAGGYYDFAKAIRAKLPVYQSPNFMTLGEEDPNFLAGPVFSR